MWKSKFEWVRNARVLLLDNYFPPFWPDLHDFDAEKVAAVAEAYYANAIRFGSMGKWSVLQTELMPQHPMLGKRDLLREMIESAHRKDLRVIVYIPTLHALPVDNVLRHHPDWAFRCSPKQDDYLYHWHAGGGQHVGLCYNTGYHDAYVRFFKHIVNNYDIDATYTDCLLPYYWGRPVCYCPNCQASFRMLFGKAMPYNADQTKLSDEDRAELEEFGKWRGRFAGDIVRELATFVKQTKDIPMMTHAVSRYPAPIWIDRDLAKHHTSLLFEAGRDTRHRIEVASYCATSGFSAMQYVGAYGSNSRVCMNRAEIAQEAAITLLSGGAAIVAGAPQFIYSYPTKMCQELVETFRVFSQQESLFDGLRPVLCVAIPWEPEDRAPILPKGFPDAALEESSTSIECMCRRGAFSALLSLHRPVNMVESQLMNEADRLAQFRLLTLPNVGFLTARQESTIRDFVRRGGSLLATYATSLYEDTGEMKQNFGLSDLLGVDLRKPTQNDVRDLYYHWGWNTGPYEIYHRVRSDTPISDDLLGGSCLLPASYFLYVRERTGAIVVSDLVLDGGFRKVAPGIVLNHYGKGRVAYISDVQDLLMYRGMDPVLRGLWRAILGWLVPDGFPLEMDGFPCLFSFVCHKPSTFVLGLVNYRGDKYDGVGWLPIVRTEDVPPIAEVNVDFHLPDGAQVLSIMDVRRDNVLDVASKSGWLNIRIRNVGAFEILRIDYA